MAFGVNLDPSIINSLVRLASRPSRADHAADRADTRQRTALEFERNQNDFLARRATQQANLDRNARAQEVFDDRQEAERTLEFQTSAAIDLQRQKDATSLQRAVLSRRQRGRTVQPGAGFTPSNVPQRRARATISDPRTGQVLQSFTGPPINQHEFSGIAEQVTDDPIQRRLLSGLADIAGKPGASGIDIKRFRDAVIDTQRGQGKIELADLQERLTRLAQINVLDSDDPDTLNIAIGNEATRIKERMREIRTGQRAAAREVTLVTDANARRAVTSFDDIPDTHIRAALEHVESLNPSTDEEADQFLMDFLRDLEYVNVRIDR